MKNKRAKYFRYLIFSFSLIGILFLTGCRLFKHKHYTKYGPPMSTYKKMSPSEANKQDQTRKIY